MLRSTVLGVVVCLAGAGLSFGQEFPKPGPEHAELKKLEGTWDAVMDMGGQKTKATATYKAICGGMWIASDFEGDLGGLAFQGHGLDGYDQNKKKYVSVWVDSWSSAPMQLEGNYDEKTKLLVMTGEAPGMSGALEKVKTTTEMKDDDHFTFKMFMANQSETEPTFTIEYTRRK